MRYHYDKPEQYSVIYGKTYYCDHPVYKKCTMYLIEDRGLAVIQQRFDKNRKTTWWDEIDPWLINDLYLHPSFKQYFDSKSGKCVDGLYPTVTVRQIMWGLKMKPLKRERWETVFDRRFV